MPCLLVLLVFNAMKRLKVDRCVCKSVEGMEGQDCSGGHLKLCRGSPRGLRAGKSITPFRILTWRVDLVLPSFIGDIDELWRRQLPRKMRYGDELTPPRRTSV